MDWHGRWRERILASGLWTIFHDKCWLPGARTCVLCFVNEKHKQTFADDIFLFIIENPEMISHYNLSHEQDVCPVLRMVGGNWGDVSENFVEGVDSRWCYQCWRWCCWCWCWSVGCVGAEIALCWCWSPGLEPLPGRLRSLLSGLTQSPPDPWGTHTHTHTHEHTQTDTRWPRHSTFMLNISQPGHQLPVWSRLPSPATPSGDIPPTMSNRSVAPQVKQITECRRNSRLSLWGLC